MNTEKIASESVVYDGGDVTYTYEATNPGRTPLEDVVVTDDRCAPLTSVDDGDAGDVLHPGEEWIYTCTATLSKSGNSSDAPETVTSVATVEGTPALPDGTPGDGLDDDATASW